MKTEIKFSEDELQKLYEALWHTWVTIADDIFTCTGKDEVDRATVIEVVLDADRLETLCNKVDREIVERFRKLSYEEQIEIAKGRFTHETYV